MAEKPLYMNSDRSIGWIVIFLTGIALYGFTLGYPFVFDSSVFLENNPLISSPGVFRGLLDMDAFIATYLHRLEHNDLFFSYLLRPVAYLTFRLNYLIGGQNPAGYRVFNIAVHIANAIMLYELLRFIIRQRNNAAETAGNVSIAFFAALLFLVHPLQTESVTCVIQRFASLGTFFYLVTVLLYLHSGTTGKVSVRRLSYASSVITLIMGLLTKEIVMTAPVALVMIDIILLRRPWRKTLLLLAPHFACMCLIPLRLIYIAGKVKGNNLDTAAIIGSAYTWQEYGITQLRAVLSYVRLLILPYDQNLDPDYPLYRSLLHPEIIISLLVWACILLAGLRLLQRRERDICTDLAGFSIFWFIVSISTSSSLIPLTDLMFEHHTYLPSLAFCTGSVAYLHHLSSSRNLFSKNTVIYGLGLAIVVFGILTVKRNVTYNSRISIYSDTVAKSPHKDRPNYALGNEYFENFQFDQAIPYLIKAIEINPDNVEAYLSLGDSYRLMQQPQIAIDLYRRFLETHPANRRILMKLARTYANSGNLPLAIDTMRILLGISRDEVQQLLFMAGSNLEVGNINEARYYLEQARKADKLDAAVDMSAKLNQLEKQLQNATARVPVRRF